jgi:hypothetical protein
MYAHHVNCYLTNRMKNAFALLFVAAKTSTASEAFGWTVGPAARCLATTQPLMAIVLVNGSYMTLSLAIPNVRGTFQHQKNGRFGFVTIPR